MANEVTVPLLPCASIDDIETFYGPIKFGANGMNAGRDMPVIQVQGGEVVLLYPAAIKQADLKPFN